jgi:broad specificity phosphatase PhoE
LGLSWQLSVRNRPARIILVRHAQSMGNADPAIYTHTADNKVAITEIGEQQAEAAGRRLATALAGQRVRFLVSPYKRSRQTLERMLPFFDPAQIAAIDEDPRIREQDWGNLQCLEAMEEIRSARREFGSFFFRFPQGESGGDVYDRASLVLESLYRRWSRERDADALVIVSHGRFCRLFLMRYFRWSVAEFHGLWNLENCGTAVLEKDPQTGRYELETLLPGRSENPRPSWGAIAVEDVPG